MQHIETKQGLMAHLIGSEHKKTNPFPKEGSITHDGRPHRDSPISQLIPGEEISCITEAEGQDEKANTDDPVELPGRPIGTGVEYPHHV
jgi:hypothetical protein